ncbi:MAG: hypothetical protein QM755_05560 [Luteolibacter sp.]
MAILWAVISVIQIREFYTWRTSGDWTLVPATLVEWRGRSGPVYQYQHAGRTESSSKTSFGICSPLPERDFHEAYISPNGRRSVVLREFLPVNFLFLFGAPIAAIAIGIGSVAIYKNERRKSAGPPASRMGEIP